MIIPYQLLKDIRVEIFLSALLQRQFLKFDQFLVKPVGLFKRPYSRDILKIEIVERRGVSQYYEIEVSREGLYDMLPEGLFHKGSPLDNKSNKKEDISNSVQAKDELYARKFFLPLEQEFIKNRIRLELEEQKIAAHGADEYTMEGETLLTGFWGINDNVFSQNQKLILLYLLPQVHKIVGNLSLASDALSLVLGSNVKLDYKYIGSSTENEFTAKSLGEMTLSADSVIGSRFTDGLPTIVIRITLNKGSDVMGFLHDGDDKRRLNCLCEYLLPAGYPLELDVVTSMKEPTFILTEVDNYLGYTTTI